MILVRNAAPILFAALFPALALAQINIRGRTVDRKLSPVAGALVRIAVSTAQATSDAAGKFQLQGSLGTRNPSAPDGFAPKLAIHAGPEAGLRLTLTGLRGPGSLDIYGVLGDRVAGTATRGSSVSLAIPEGDFPLLAVLTGAEGLRAWRIPGPGIQAVPVTPTSLSAGATAKAAALPDTVTFQCLGMLAKKSAVTAYDLDLGDLVLPYFQGPGDTLFLQGFEQYLRAKDYVKAAAAFRLVRSNFAGSDNALAALAYLGKSQSYLGQYDSAAATLGQYLTLAAKGPDANDAYYFRGRSFYGLGRYAEARLDFDRVLTDFASAGEADGAAYYRARTWYQEGNFAQALADLRKFPPAYPSSTYLDNAYLYWGKSEMRGAAADSARYRRAVLQFQRVLAQFPTSASAPAAQAELGTCWYFLADYPNARLELAKVEARYPASAEVADAAYYLGRTDVQQVRYDSALAQFRKVVARYPTSVLVDNAHYQIGKALYLAGRYTEAVASLKETKRIYPASSLGDNVELYLIRAYVKLSDCVSSKSELAVMKSAFPASPYLASASASVTAKCP